MIQQPGNGLVEIIVKGIYALGLRVICLAYQAAPAHHQLPEILADVGAVGKVFRNDVVGSGQGILDGIDAQLFVDVFLGKALGVGTVLGEDGLGQGSQPLFSCHGAPGAPLLLVGTVEVLYLGHGLGLINGGG